MRVFHKPVIDITAQIELLKQRGLHIQDDTRARHFLQAVSFFRLTPYMRTFQQAEDEDHPFRKGAGFRDLTTLYDFDRRLRLLVMDAIERVEVAVRSLISNHMGPNHGRHWYMEARLFQHSYDHARLLETIRTKQNAARRDYEKECQRIDRLQTDEGRKDHLKHQRAKESYARHYPVTYDQPSLMPGWAMLEELTLGDLSHLYKGLARDADKKVIARCLELPAPLLQSWLHTLTTIRNICAHHARLWNRELGIRPELPKKTGFSWPLALLQQAQHPRIFSVLCILSHLMRQVSPHTSWDHRLRDLMQEFPNVNQRAMGFPQDWHQDPFWQIAE
ncbi:Abi family protein [Pseudomonas frederiksbergensis]|uniref:Abi family protein n=1 Tax=Pseudomonas frederiksbergensis TaxID=104087 RepID=UPI003D1CA4A8